MFIPGQRGKGRIIAVDSPVQSTKKYEVGFVSKEGFRVVERYEFLSSARYRFDTLKLKDAAGLKLQARGNPKPIDTHNGANKI